MSTTEGVPAREGMNDDPSLTATSPSGDKKDPESPTTSGSDESVVKQLRDKLAESGRRERETSDLADKITEQNRQLQEFIATQKQSMEPKPNGETGYDQFTRVMFDSESTPEQSQAAFVAALRKSAEDAANAVEAKFAPQMEALNTKGRANRAYNYGREFFQSKGMPELAEQQGPFYAWVVDEMTNKGNPFLRGIWSSVDDAPEQVFPVVYDKYLDHMGIKVPTTTPEQRAEMEEAALVDHPSNILAVSKDAVQAVETAADTAGRDLSMFEMSQVLAKEGHFDKQ